MNDFAVLRICKFYFEFLLQRLPFKLLCASLQSWTGMERKAFDCPQGTFRGRRFTWRSGRGGVRCCVITSGNDYPSFESALGSFSIRLWRSRRRFIIEGLGRRDHSRYSAIYVDVFDWVLPQFGAETTFFGCLLSGGVKRLPAVDSERVDRRHARSFTARENFLQFLKRSITSKVKIMTS